MFGMTWMEIGALVVGLWAVTTLRFIGSVAVRVDKILGELGLEERDDPKGLPSLTEAEMESLGYRMGQANVLPGEWSRVWRREYLHARLEKKARGTK